MLAAAPVAHALTSEGQVWGGVGAASIQHAAPSAFGWWGPAVDIGGVFLLNDFWRLTLDAGASHHFETTDEDDEPIGPHTVASAAVGVRYAFDIAIYVPFAEVAAVVHPMGPPSSASPQGELFSMRATLGFDYRKSRRISFGGAVNVYAPLSQLSDFPHYSSVRAHVGYHFHRH